MLTSFGRVRRMTERAAKRLPEPPDVLELDVNSDDDLAALADGARASAGAASTASSTRSRTPRRTRSAATSWRRPARAPAPAFETSAYSLKALAAAIAPLMATRERRRPAGGSIVGLDFDASVAWPAYDWMGVAKAALESVSRYLARDLGPAGVRVNLVSAGPVATAGRVRDPRLRDARRRLGGTAPRWAGTAPTPAPVADAALFLLSDLARAISGEILHVDGGFHAIGAAGAVTPAVSESPT